MERKYDAKKGVQMRRVQLVNQSIQSSEDRAKVSFPCSLLSCPYTARPVSTRGTHSFYYNNSIHIVTLSPRPWEALLTPQNVHEPFQLYSKVMVTLDVLLPSIPSLSLC